jgi:hypothetical protein
LVPNLPTTSARIRVTDYYNTCKNAISAQNFTITAATPQLFITSPNGGEQLYPGTGVGIYWTNNYVPGSFVKLEYSTDSGANWTTIVTNTSLTTGYYNWSVQAYRLVFTVTRKA